MIKNKSKKPTRSKSLIVLFSVCLLFSLYLAFFQLGKAPLENWDEAWYAEVTKQMLRSKDFIVLHWNGNVWFEKPPMYMWLSALVSSIIGLSELSVRFTSALSGVVIIMLVTLYSYKKFGIVPSLLAFISLALNSLFIWRTRSGNIDILVTLLILLTYFVQISKTKYKYPSLGLLFALIYLTKASLVIFPLSIFILHELCFERKKLLKQYRQYIKLVTIFFLIPGIWLLLGYLKAGPALPYYYLFRSDQGVAHIALDYFNTDYILHTYYSLHKFFYLFILGAIFALLHIKDSKYFLLLLYSSALLLQLSFTAKDNNWYLIPSIPFWSILIAFGIYHIIKIVKENKIVVGLIIALCLYISFRTFTVNILPILDSASAVKQAESSKILNELTNSEDIIVRLDHLYPTTIFYSDRKVLSLTHDNTDTVDHWIVKRDLIKAMENKEIKWIVGKNSDIENLKNDAPTINIRLIKVNDEETIGEVL